MGLERKGFFMPFVREQSGGTLPTSLTQVQGTSLGGTGIRFTNLTVGGLYVTQGKIASITGATYIQKTETLTNYMTICFFQPTATTVDVTWVGSGQSIIFKVD